MEYYSQPINRICNTENVIGLHIFLRMLQLINSKARFQWNEEKHTKKKERHVYILIIRDLCGRRDSLLLLFDQ